MTNFKPTKQRTALASNEIFEKNRYKLSMNAQALLWGLAQSIDHTESLFPEIGIDITGLFEYLGVQDRNDRYDLVRDAFFEITGNPLQYNAGPKKWSSIPWMSVQYNEEMSNFVTVKFTKEIRPYLLQLKGYVKIQGGYVSKLNSEYAGYLYPQMKMILGKYYGTREISFERLKELTFTDDKKKHKSYNVGSGATNNFCRRVLGVKYNSKTKKVEILKDSPIYEINTKTDITVKVEFVKNGMKYVGVRFFVKSKNQKASSKNVAQISSKGVGTKSIPLKDVYEFATASGMNVKDYCEQAGYVVKGNFAYKKTHHRTGRDSKVWQDKNQTSLKEAFDKVGK